MIVTAHLLCGGRGGVWGRFFYNITTARFARFGGKLPQENFEK